MSRYKSLLASVVAMAVMSAYVSPLYMNTASADQKKEDKPKALSFQMKDLDGKPVDLSVYEGKAVLFVNVASKCGLTPQYEGLQKLYDKYGEKGLAIVGVPCNQFKGQEPGSNKEIREFCTSKYNVTFDLLDKVDVNGENACPLYKFLTSQETSPVGAGDISWNFEKFLLDRHGNVVARFGPRVAPSDTALVEAIEKALAK